MIRKARDQFSRLLLVSDGRGGINQYVLERDRYTVGRALDNDICIQNKTVSSHHAELRWQDGGFLLTDLDSRNGTFVNRKRTDSRRLAHGDKVYMASAELAVDKVHRPRSGEIGTVPFRTGRYFSANGGWYFCTREGEEVGPFDSRAEAQAGLSAYLRKIGIRTGFDDLYSL